MDKARMLAKIAEALTAAGFNDVSISEDGDAVLFNDENYDCWAVTPERF